MTELEFNEVLTEHEKWFNKGASVHKDGNKMRLEYKVVSGYWTNRYLNLVNLRRCIFRNAIFENCNFSDCWMAECSFYGCRFEHCYFKTSYMYGDVFNCCGFLRCEFDNCNLSAAMIHNCDFSESIIESCTFKKSNITNTNFETSTLEGSVNFVKANIQDSYFPESNKYICGRTLVNSIVGYKNTREGVVIKAEIPAGAIVFSINGKKCRTNRARIIDMNGRSVLHSSFDFGFTYELGQEIEIHDFDTCYSHECAPGFHFFKTEKEAKEYHD